MNSKLYKILFAVIGGIFLVWSLIWVNRSHGGDYVTYKDPSTGVRYYGDALPPNAPSNVRVEVKHADPVSTVGRSSNWNNSVRGVAPIVPAQPSNPQPSQGYNIMNHTNREWERTTYQSSQPIRPSTGPVYRDFNRVTNAWGKYEADMFEWRSRGRELRQEYNEPNGFNKYPTGFSEGEKRRLNAVK